MSPVATPDLEMICVQKLATRLRTQRLRTGWSLEELAERAGVSRSTLHHLEHGTTQHPRLLTLHRLAKAFGVEVEVLVPPGTAVDLGGVSPAADPGSTQGFAASGAAWDAGGETFPTPRHPTAVGWEGGKCGPAAERAGGKVPAVGANLPEPGALPGVVGPRGMAGGLAAVEPGLFRDWTWSDWAAWETQLSTLGEVGLDRLREAAWEVNRHRETRQQLQALLGSPLAQVATQLIQTLFDTACRGALGGQVPSA